jgi:hypothetical protein
MSRPTPETDEQFKSFPAYFEIDLFCRKLERERDEAWEQAQQMSESNKVLMADVRFYRNALEQLKEKSK